MGGLHTVIFLSFVLALGFLLVILSCALWGNWMPIWSTVAFVLAPMPNVVFGGLAGADSFSDFNNAYIDFGNFVTGMLIMTGIALPLLLSHNDVISSAAALLSLAGGALVYGTSASRKKKKKN
ncbi:Vps55p [Malassezia vespertilionis]|uniref:Vps55p n=1 Tax=Malassezia vespertilionis TaxID=2020962 RepID=A0A2N1JEG3_9BASI|nr:Vps55p [Malassezia vespertilionis]